MLVCRCEQSLNRDLKDKIASSCGVARSCVIESPDLASIYQLPLNFMAQDILEPIAKQLNLGKLNANMQNWDSLVKRVVAPNNAITIAFVGKYTDLKESYKSLTESIIHAGASLDTRVNLKWCDSERIDENNVGEIFKDCSGILVAGGFGGRGVEGMICSAKYAREHKIPYLGICLGMQIALIEFARNVLGLENANSMEFDSACKENVIYLIDNFIDASGTKQIRTHKSPLGGTMRLGSYECELKKGSLLAKIYDNQSKIIERHRHRYEANPKYRQDYEKNGLIISGQSKGLIEACELKNHPFFLGVQFHPEFTSRLTKPNPVILGFIKVSCAE